MATRNQIDRQNNERRNNIEAQKMREQQRHNFNQEDISRNTLQEQKRSNRANENLARRGQNVKAATDAFGAGLRAFNDVSWYNLDEQLLKDVSSFAFGAPLGQAVDIGEAMITNTPASNTWKKALPGIGALVFEPMFPESSPGSPIEVAMRNIYAFDRQANSGATNYEAPDLLLYLTAMGSSYMVWADMRRLYSVLRTAKGHNFYYSKRMVEALGYDAEDLQNHIADLRALINQFEVSLNAFNVPDTLPLFKRWVWMTTNIFKDDAIKKSQEYVFVPRTYFKYNDTGFLEIREFHNLGDTGSTYVPVTFEVLRKIVNDLIQSMMTDDDFATISGDVLKAYGEGGLVKLDSTPIDYHIESVWEPEVLTQITGATIIGEPLRPAAVQPPEGQSVLYEGRAIYQQDNQLYRGAVSVLSGTPATFYVLGEGLWTVPVDNIGAGSTAGAWASTLADVFKRDFINMDKDDVTAGDAMVATRLKASAEISGNRPDGWAAGGSLGVFANWTNLGSEVVVHFVMFTRDTYYPIHAIQKLYTGMNASILKGVFDSLTVYAKFDWAPQVRLLKTTTETPTNSSSITLDYLVDVQNYSPITAGNLLAMHTVALLSEFGVPLAGRSVR